MKLKEAKVAFQTWAEDIIDVWFGSGNMVDSLAKPAIKTILKNNIDKADDVLKLFINKQGELDIEGLLDQYMKDSIPKEGIVINPKDLFGDNFVTRMISPKLLERSDIIKLKSLINNEL